MNLRFKRFYLSVGLALWVSGCGQPNNTPATNNPLSSAVAPGSASEGRGTVETPREVMIEVGDTMKFSRTRVVASAGEVIRLKLVNLGAAPKEVMGHNWILLRSGADEAAFLNAALGAKATDYVPAAKAGDIIAHTKLLGGGRSDAVVFTVPAEPGDYVYLCSFPAHIQLGMKGVLVVR
jgi:azurin